MNQSKLSHTEIMESNMFMIKYTIPRTPNERIEVQKGDDNLILKTKSYSH